MVGRDVFCGSFSLCVDDARGWGGDVEEAVGGIIRTRWFSLGSIIKINHAERMEQGGRAALGLFSRAWGIFVSLFFGLVFELFVQIRYRLVGLSDSISLSLLPIHSPVGRSVRHFARWSINSRRQQQHEQTLQSGPASGLFFLDVYRIVARGRRNGEHAQYCAQTRGPAVIATPIF